MHHVLVLSCREKNPQRTNVDCREEESNRRQGSKRCVSIYVIHLQEGKFFSVSPWMALSPLVDVFITLHFCQVFCKQEPKQRTDSQSIKYRWFVIPLLRA